MSRFSSSTRHAHRQGVDDDHNAALDRSSSEQATHCLEQRQEALVDGDDDDEQGQILEANQAQTNRPDFPIFVRLPLHCQALFFPLANHDNARFESEEIFKFLVVSRRSWEHYRTSRNPERVVNRYKLAFLPSAETRFRAVSGCLHYWLASSFPWTVPHVHGSSNTAKAELYAWSKEVCSRTTVSQNTRACGSRIVACISIFKLLDSMLDVHNGNVTTRSTSSHALFAPGTSTTQLNSVPGVQLPLSPHLSLTHVDITRQQTW